MVLKEFMEGWRKGTKFYIHDVTGYVKFDASEVLDRQVLEQSASQDAIFLKVDAKELTDERMKAFRQVSRSEADEINKNHGLLYCIPGFMAAEGVLQQSLKVIGTTDNYFDNVKYFTPVLEEVIVYTDCLTADHRGDFVKCSDCGTLMLIQIGSTACGECESENLQWYDTNKPEWNIEELENAGFIIVEK